MAKDADEIKKFPLRMPIDLHGKIVKLAEDDRRSIHAEILVLLQEAIEQREETQEKSPKDAPVTLFNDTGTSTFAMGAITALPVAS